MKSSPRFEEMRPHREERPEAVRSAVAHQPAGEHFPVAAQVSVADRRVGDAVAVPEAAGAARHLT